MKLLRQFSRMARSKGQYVAIRAFATGGSVISMVLASGAASHWR